MVETLDFTPNQALMIAIRLEADGKQQEAEDIYRGILEIDPNHFNALNRLGAVLTNKKSYYEALYRFDRAIRLNQNAAMAISNKGMILGELGHLEESEAEFRKAISIEPENHVFWNNLGITLERLCRYKEALEATDQGLSLLEEGETSSTMLLDKGVILQRLNKYAQAISCFTQALEIDPSIPEAHYNLAICKLVTGDLVGGFKEYEWRSKVETERGNSIAFYINNGKPKWYGEDISDKTIILHAEQGLGDTIQFLRYVPLVIDRAKEVHLIVHSGLISIVSHCFGSKVNILLAGEKYPEHDYVCSLMSLPLAFKTTSGTIPPPLEAPIIYKYVEARKNDIIGSGLKVGLCWSGNWKQKNDFRRSVKFEDFKPILDTPGCTFYSLQKEVRQEDQVEVSACKNLIDLKLGDFLDTAAVISMLDLIITVDTSVCHLAGSIGKKTWCLVPSRSYNWVWQQGRKDTPWYQSVRLFRQAMKDNNWTTTIDFVVGKLQGLLAYGN